MECRSKSCARVRWDVGGGNGGVFCEKVVTYRDPGTVILDRDDIVAIPNLGSRLYSIGM